MSDIFTHLMNRSSGIADVLRPRRSSIFEPVIPELPATANLFPLTRNLGAKLDEDSLSGVTRQNRGRNEKDSTRAFVSPEISPRPSGEMSMDCLEGVERLAEEPSQVVERQPGTSPLQMKHLSLNAQQGTAPGWESELSPRPEESPQRAREAHDHSLLLLETEARLNPGVPVKGVT